MSFINENVKIEKGIRKAVSISGQELEQKIIDRAREVKNYSPDTQVELKSAIFDIIGHDEIIKNDCNVDFHCENMTINPKSLFGSSLTDDTLVGTHTLDNEFSFIGVQAGGDWEYPTFFILYYDGENVRMYIPSRGNCINLDFMSAFGSESLNYYTHTNGISATEFFNKLEQKYKDLGIWDELVKDKDNFEWDEETAIKLYSKQYDDFGFHWHAIKDDIMTAIEII